MVALVPELFSSADEAPHTTSVLEAVGYDVLRVKAVSCARLRSAATAVESGDTYDFEAPDIAIT